MNPDLPQHEHGVAGWMEITTAYDLAGYVYAIPVAIQVLTHERRSLSTGIITGTWDQFHAAATNNDNPRASIIYFRDAEPLHITWGDTKAVLAMVAVVTGEEEEHGEGRQGGDRDDERE